MDTETLQAYDSQAASFAQDWHEQPPVDLTQYRHSGARVFARTRNPGGSARGKAVWIPGSPELVIGPAKAGPVGGAPE
jgi:hypothetical protein